ncbi:uncharacterized protein LOC127436889 isoform X1 [Myxocyprinus asiaticus]|uniref:uncharacterized protein LOC127436889 isoform X1 n=1 Tax=Myxocyprinus asiaticus TaxID=70543 RepID=UPI002222570A|nr:uncharacterized protein LOC127436889 isoform X1 [Myxocyprinus asiaticus]
MPPLSESKVFRKCVWTHEFGPQLQVDLCKDLHSGTDYKEPEILSLEPNKVSFRGRNRVLLRGTNLESVTKIHIRGDLDCIPKDLSITFGNSTVDCVDHFSYLPDPEFTGFTTSQESDSLLVYIQKKADKLNLSKSEMNVTGLQGDQEHECVLEWISSHVIFCEIKQLSGAIITLDSLTIRVGNSFVIRMGQSSAKYLFCLSPQKPSENV